MTKVTCPEPGSQMTTGSVTAPAEVAEGAGRPSWDKIISDLRDVVSKLPAAPSLSREDWQILSAALAVYAMGDANLTALLAKIREASKSHP